jgi:hypothetical protein
MIESIIDLNIIHPAIYIRLPKNKDDKLLSICAKYMMSGNNRAQILNDVSIIEALTKNGIPYKEAVHYACGGCMEIGVQGKQSDFLYVGWQNVSKMLELMISGGISLTDNKIIKGFNSKKGLIKIGKQKLVNPIFIGLHGTYKYKVGLDDILINKTGKFKMNILYNEESLNNKNIVYFSCKDVGDYLSAIVNEFKLFNKNKIFFDIKFSHPENLTKDN